MRPQTAAVATLLILLLLVEGRAAADEPWKAVLEDPALRSALRGTVKRGRRALSVGPLVGGAASFAPSPGELDGAISLGLGVYLSKVPVVPTPEMVKRILEERLRAKLEERARAMIARGEAPSSEDLARMARELYEEVKADVLAELNAPPRPVEKPRFDLTLEAAHQVRAEAWQLRAGLGIGVSYVSIGASLALHIGDEVDVLLGPELGVALTPGDGPRSPVIDLFLRYDAALIHEETPDQVVLGARLLLDLI